MKNRPVTANGYLEKNLPHPMKEIASAEKKLTQAVLNMQKASNTEELIIAMGEHLTQTADYIAMLEKTLVWIRKNGSIKK